MYNHIHIFHKSTYLKRYDHLFVLAYPSNLVLFRKLFCQDYNQDINSKFITGTSYYTLKTHTKFYFDPQIPSSNIIVSTDEHQTEIRKCFL